MTHTCCNSDSDRHSRECPLFTVTGKLKMPELQRTILTKAAPVSLPGDGVSIRGRGPHAAAKVLEDKGLVRVGWQARPFGGSQVYATDEGKRLAALLEKT